MKRAFTLIEILVVIAIIAILASISFPAIRAMTKSNGAAQAVNLIRSEISAARNIAIAQRRTAGVVFFEEDAAYSSPAHPGVTVAQIIVEDYNQLQTGVGSDNDYQTSDRAAPTSIFGIDNRFAIGHGYTVFVAYSTERQYLPRNMLVATLSGDAGLTTGATTGHTPIRAIVFDKDGQLIILSGMTTPDIGTKPAGEYPRAYGDWQFVSRYYNISDPLLIGAGSDLLKDDASSSGAFLVYNRQDFEEAGMPTATDAERSVWLKNHGEVVSVNGFTGNVLR